ncbi:hypothetical protein HYPSUDRAFT_49656 [Hypholoma sublateritium FD-334 SS-4]|uniref:Thiaminase-2/PQQC domain-containing protein n=1 Tax=Hypholoma sublateritium (strain FD-334 SS-4) TaxID=945553 RepID=A0A0D2LSG3_HYPSF|nr:hypothetical protein HYPSUDRAFT_49656 [Hypholoma sublateritium FD-334 SS-4]
MSEITNYQALSAHLLSLTNEEKYTAATRHTFLTHATIGTLPLARLALWLAQDRIYAAHAYPRFIGALIAAIPFSAADGVSSPRERRNAEVLRVLVGCLDNIVKEVGFFGDVAAEWGMDLDAWNQRKATRDYTAEMSRISTQGSLEEGLVFLWAMEKIYLDAWSSVKNLEDRTVDPDEKDPVAIAAVRSFANNWSSPDFVTFVDTLRALVDGLNISPVDELYSRVENIWKRVVELEVEFWPHDGEELEAASKKQPAASKTGGL